MKNSNPTQPGCFATSLRDHLSFTRATMAAVLFGMATFPLATPVEAATLAWGGASGDYATPANWALGAVPADNTTTDNALFSSGTYTVNLTADRSVAQLRPVNASGLVSLNFGTSTLTTPSVIVGLNSGGNASLTSGTIAGSGASAQFTVGFSGNGAALSVDNSTVSNINQLFVGRTLNAASSNATNATLTLQNGGTIAATSVVVGAANHEIAATGNTLSVTGAGSALTAGNVVVGLINTATSGATSTGNQLVVNNGGAVNVLGGVLVGHRSTGTLTALSGNGITVGGTGTGSSLTIGGVLQVGQFAGSNTVSVNTGGTITATSAGTTVFNQAGNRLEVAGGLFDATGQNVLVNRDLTVSSGTLLVGTLSSDAIGTFNATLSGGTLEAGTVNSNHASLFTVGNGAGATMKAVISGTGTHTLGNAVVLNSDAILEASGTIATVAASSGNHLAVSGSRLSPGGSAITDLSFDMGTTSGNFRLENSAVIQMDLGVANAGIGSIAAGSSDLVSILGASAGDVAFSFGTLGGSTSIDFANSATGLGFYKLFDTSTDNANTWSGLTFDLTTGIVSQGLLAANVGGGFGTEFIVGTASNGAANVGDIYVQVIPEPNVFALLVSGLGLLSLARRKRSATAKVMK